jgi:CBS domain-containing protein
MIRVKHLLERKGVAPGRPVEVWTIDADQPVLKAIQVMAERHIGALPVMRQGQLAGVMSERDYARKVILMGRSSADTPVAQIMSSPVITVGPEESVRQCMQTMTEKRIRHLPVVADGKLVGMISIGDLVRAVIEEQQDTIRELERFITG